MSLISSEMHGSTSYIRRKEDDLGMCSVCCKLVSVSFGRRQAFSGTQQVTSSI